MTTTESTAPATTTPHELVQDANGAFLRVARVTDAHRTRWMGQLRDEVLRDAGRAAPGDLDFFMRVREQAIRPESVTAWIKDNLTNVAIELAMEAAAADADEEQIIRQLNDVGTLERVLTAAGVLVIKKDAPADDAEPGDQEE